MAVATPSPERVAGRRNLQKQGKALPPNKSGGAPRYPIPNIVYLDKAIKAVGRAKPGNDAQRAMIRRYIMKRASALGATSHIPDTWNSDGSLKSAGS